MMKRFLTVALAALTSIALATGTRAQSASNVPLTVAVIGDDTLRTVVLEQSAVPCGPPPYPAPCVYQDASPLAYPALLGSAGNDVAVLSAPGQNTAQPIGLVIQTQVPQISRTADVVVVNAGITEVVAGDETNGIEQFRKLIAAIRARAPQARIVALGLRDATGSIATAAAVADWNERARTLVVATGGIFIDMRALFPANDFPDFPDSFHPSQIGSKRIAEALQTALSLKPQAPAAAATPGAVLTAPSSSAGLPPLPSAKTKLTIAVIGSSMERAVVQDNSTVPCGIVMRATPCVYDFVSPVSYPALLGLLVNATIDNLSVAGSQAADAKTSGTIPSALESQVPLIPSDADIVILQIGLNDTSISGTVESTLKRIDEVVAAVREHAPRAHIVFVSLRDYGTSIHARIDAWNAREVAVARSIGAPVVDIRKAFPATDYPDFPDGTHASVIGAMRIAQMIEAVINSMRIPAAAPK